MSKKLSYEDIEELSNEQTITNGEEFWKYLVLEFLKNVDEFDYNITEKDIDNIVENIMGNDELWNTIDGVMVSELVKFKK